MTDAKAQKASDPKAGTKRKPLVGGNWKSNGLLASITELVAKLNECTFESNDVDVVVAPTLLHLGTVRSSLRKDMAVAAQNCSLWGPGAYTGEVNAAQLKDFGVQWVILGHSERRHLMKESDKDVSDKVKHALSQSLNVILCVGETADERKTNETATVVTRQLKAVTDAIGKTSTDWNKLVIAYEPVWAIGTGVVATPAQAQAVHADIRAWIAKNVSPDVAQAVRIIYGGSVSKDNCASLIAQADIDGFLVGGASLKAPDFCAIIDCTRVKK